MGTLQGWGSVSCPGPTVPGEARKQHQPGCLSCLGCATMTHSPGLTLSFLHPLGRNVPHFLVSRFQPQWRGVPGFSVGFLPPGGPLEPSYLHLRCNHPPQSSEVCSPPCIC